MKLKDKKEFAENLARYSAIPTFVIDSQHKVLYWNKACEELTGIKASEVVGTDNQWKAFYDSRRPCLADMVINNELSEQSEHYTKFRRSPYVSSGLHAETCISDPGGKKRYIVFDAAPIYNSEGELIAALQTLQDLTEQKQAEQKIKRKLKIEETIAAITSMFVGPADIDTAIESALGEVGRLCGASRSYVFLLRENEPVMDNTHEWCYEGVEPQKENLQNLPTDMYPWWMARLNNGEIIHIPEVSSMPPEASAEKEILEIQDIQSLLVLPLYSAGELTGFIGMDNVVNTGEWKDYEISALYMVSSVIGMAMERKRAEFDLKESEEKYRNLVERANDGIAIIQDGMVKYVNPRIAEIMGYTVEELTNSFFTDYLHPDEHLKVLDYYRRRMAGEDVPQIYETVVKHKGGSDVDIEFNAGIILYEGLKADFVIVRDITERKRAEKELLASEERFRGLFENIPVAILEEDFSDVKNYIETLTRNKHIDDLEAYLVQHPDVVSRCAEMMKILDVNQAALELHEAGSKSELLENIEMTFTSESYETFCKELLAILNGETEMETDAVVQTLSGMPREIAVHWSVSPGHEETLSSVLVSLINITERKKVEEELHAAHQKLMDIIEFLPDATFVIDAEKKVIAWNRAIEDMTGIKKEGIIGKGDYAYAVPFYGKRRPILIDFLSVPNIEIKQKYNSIEKKGYSLYAEAFTPSAYGGKGAHLAGKASLLFDSSGKCIGAIESIRDITDRKRDEDNLKKYAEELQNSNELKDLFTDILHHDLLNPAGIVKGYTEILSDLEEDEKKGQYLQIIERNNEKLIGILERASKFAKLQSVKELKFKTMDIGVIFKEVIGNFMPRIDEKQMVLEFSANGRYCAKVNPVIEEVFSNLLSNAIKYGPQKSRIIIDITDAGDEWKVVVTDFGEGISDEDKTRLFERFRRANRKNVKGTGLGLAIVKRLINLHGGSVGVEDNPEGRGSRFWVTVKKA